MHFRGAESDEGASRRLMEALEWREGEEVLGFRCIREGTDVFARAPLRQPPQRVHMPFRQGEPSPGSGSDELR